MPQSLCLCLCLLLPSVASAGIIDDLNLDPQQWEVRHWSLSGVYPTNYSLDKPWMQFTSGESWLGGKEYKCEIESLNLKNSLWYDCLPLIDNYAEGSLSFPLTILDMTFRQYVPYVGERPTNVDEWFDAAGHFNFKVEDPRTYGNIWTAMNASGTYAVRVNDPLPPPPVAEPAAWVLLLTGMVGLTCYYAGVSPAPRFFRRKAVPQC